MTEDEAKIDPSKIRVGDEVDVRMKVAAFSQGFWAAVGKLETSEAAGIVEGWKERALAAEAHASALQAEHVAYEHAHETAVELGFPSLTEALEALSALQGEVDGLREAVMRLTTRIRSAFLSQEHDVKVNGAAHPGLLEPMRDILRDIHGEALAALSQDQGGR